ncbi:serine acetyltransferase [Halanaeroarchaeum sulfurireducens]|uniref:Serine acetyltransferase n=1 Tax=Halanaeroarchaeum sulfurireducens TaxID=1604004 RepID=A0A0F7P9G2_9EURY|nr:serine acetyltransferase [Halanaeroarchaeum sulfurireducens]
MISRIVEDIRTALDRDPAARNALEVLLTYQGLHAIWSHRISHALWESGFHLPARLLSHFSRFVTGIEIHPGATIGRRFFIDHGGGVVIGETADIGDDVLLFQGCTLGGTSNKPVKRHPTIEDNVVIGAGAILLGPITIGAHSKIGAGSVVLDDYPEHSTIVGIPATSSDESGPFDLEALEHGDLPDPLHREFEELNDEVDRLRNRIDELESHLETDGDDGDSST